MNEENVQDTMNIILNAGDARTFIMKALDCIGDYDYEQARENLKKANEKLVIAHKLQTDRLRSEADGASLKYSVLFTHAQDTLMTIYSEYNITKHMVTIFEKIDTKKG